MSAPAAPRRRAPEGACDTHAHVFGPQSLYPWSEGRGYAPPDAPLDDWLALLRVLGVTRGVLTRPSVYGIGNKPFWTPWRCIRTGCAPWWR